MGNENNIIKFYHKNNIEIVKGKSSHTFPKHSHNTLCVGTVISGKMQLMVQKKEYLLESDDVYFIPKHIEHTISSVNGSKYEYIVLCINDNVQTYNNVILDKYVFKGKAAGIEIKNIIRKFKASNDENYLENMLLNFLGKYLEADYVHSRNSNNKTVLSAVEFIKNNLNSAFDLQELSEYTNITKYHLVRLFKAHMGATPYQFYLQEKLKQIRKGLLEQQPISDLVFDFSFTDESHLCNTFKKHIGITPMQFKGSYKKY